MKKLLSAATALTLALGVMATSSAPAEAGRGGRVAAGVAAGIIGLGILGAYAHARDRHYYYAGSCYRVPGHCYWKEGYCWYNRWGERHCRRGYRVCEPARTICD